MTLVIKASSTLSAMYIVDVKGIRRKNEGRENSAAGHVGDAGLLAGGASAAVVPDFFFFLYNVVGSSVGPST